ncbi:MAG TPA: hypothetical protein VF665_05025 [Longimicrobium sp.]|jgi:hypothetical protein|uniref:hypothetical protein n=1 Tax=Longimicrobium sp. TaxID=2029185 RepID=UPI002ED930E2
MNNMIRFALLAAVVAAVPASAQAVISRGMTQEQVRAAFGAPATTRESGEWTYWYYLNGCAVRCGSDDVVFFRDDRVVAAVLRTRRRTITGPRADDALEQAGGGEQTGSVAADGSGRVVVGGLQVNGAPAATERTQVIVVPGDARRSEDTGVTAREARPGEAPTVVIGATAAQNAPGGVSNGTTVFPRAGAPATGATVTGTVRAAEPTSIDRASQRLAEDRANEESSIDRAARRRAEDRANEESSVDRAARRDAEERGIDPTAVERARINGATAQPAAASPTVVPTPAPTPEPAPRVAPPAAAPVVRTQAQPAPQPPAPRAAAPRANPNLAAGWVERITGRAP